MGSLVCGAGPTTPYYYTPESFFVKSRNDSMEEHRSKRILDQVRVCRELAEGMPSASNTIPIAPSRMGIMQVAVRVLA